MNRNLSKLAASPVPSLTSKSRFRNDLLLDQTWPSEVNWLRDTYSDIVTLWDEIKDTKQDKELYRITYPKLKELVLSLNDITPRVPRIPMAGRYMMNARHDFEIAKMYSNSGDFASAVTYQFYSLRKIHLVLEVLTRAGSEEPRNRFSSFNVKTAYGYDISGEIFDGSKETANRENQTNINDTAQPQDHHETSANPANGMRDVDADKEFPELGEKHKRVIWPPRGR